MKRCKCVILFFMLILLVGCGKTAMTPKELVQEASIILTVDDQTMLVDETMWRVTDKTKIKTQSGTKIAFTDLKMGDLISYENDGPIAESYPGQGTLKKITLLNDESSLKLSSAITSFLENQPHGDLVRFEMLGIEGDELSAHIRVWDLEANGQYLVQLNIETNQFTIVEES